MSAYGEFLRGLVDDPKGVSAPTPSGPALSAAIAAKVDLKRPGLVVELGAGTGVVTEALVQRGIAPSRLVVVESGEFFCKLLKRRFPAAHVVMGELYDTWEGIPTDTHVRRFALRFDLTSKTELTKISKDLETLVPKKDWKYVNNGLVLYGRYLCPARPHDCDDHPLTMIWPPAAMRWPKAK